MYCPLCENLERALAARQSEYMEASSLACHLVTKKFAAYRNVEMERARTELQEHRMVCVAAADANPAVHALLLRRARPVAFRQQRAVHAA